jgi:hypothetical protein
VVCHFLLGFIFYVEANGVVIHKYSLKVMNYKSITCVAESRFYSSFLVECSFWYTGFHSSYKSVFCILLLWVLILKHSFSWALALRCLTWILWSPFVLYFLYTTVYVFWVIHKPTSQFFPPDLFLYVNFITKGTQKILRPWAPELTVLGITHFWRCI